MTYGLLVCSVLPLTHKRHFHRLFLLKKESSKSVPITKSVDWFTVIRLVLLVTDGVTLSLGLPCINKVVSEQAVEMPWTKPSQGVVRHVMTAEWYLYLLWL